MFCMGLVNIVVSKCNLVDYIGQYTELKRSGDVYRGRCPIHGGSNPTSLCVINSNFYYCHSCGSSGSVVNFVSDKDGIGYHGAVEILAGELNIDVGNHQDYQAEKDLALNNNRFLDNAKRQVSRVYDYLTKDRGLTKETIDTFELGWFDEGMLIPIHDVNGSCAAFARRNFNTLPKYVNSKNNILYDKSATLYNLHRAKRMLRDGNLYIVEGYMDAMSGYQMGLATVATCGSRITREQVSLLAKLLPKNSTIVYCPDNDKAGRDNIYKARSIFAELAPSFNIRVMVIEDGSSIKDMNDMLVQGIDPRSLATEHIDSYVLTQIISQCDSIEEQYAKAEEFIGTVYNPMIKLDLVRLLSRLWDKPEEVLRGYFSAMGASASDVMDEFSDIESCINDLRGSYASGGFKTGFDKIDYSIRRLRRKQVVVLGAYSYSGKTDFAIEMALNAIAINKMRVMFFSLEMPKGQLIERAMAKIIGVPNYEVERLLEEGDEAAVKVRDVLGKYLIVVDKNNLSMGDINSRIKLANSRGVLGGNIDMVIIDCFTYLKGVNTFEGASAAALALKGIAKDNDIVLVMLSQLNREGSNFDEPSMRQLRMTGDLEASADVIFLLWRPGLNPKLSLEDTERPKYQTMVKLEKARDGIYGAVRFEFEYDPKTSRLSPK